MKLVRESTTKRVKDYIGEVELTEGDKEVVESVIIIDKTLLKHLLVMIDKHDPRAQKLRIFKVNRGYTDDMSALCIETRRQYDEQKNHVYAVGDVKDVNEPGIPSNYNSDYPKVSKKELNTDLPVLPLMVKRRRKQNTTEFYIEPKPGDEDE